MDLTIDDVKAMALELWLAQRENTRLRQDNGQLVAELEKLRPPATTAEGGQPCPSPQETCPTPPPPPAG